MTGDRSVRTLGVVPGHTDGTQIAADIREWVDEGSLGPGDFLPAAPELAAWCGVDIEIVQHAFAELEALGLLRTVPGGAEVLPFSAEALHRSIDRMAELEAVGLTELIRFRALLECWAYQLAARRAAPADLAELDAALAAMTAAVDAGPEAFAAADVAFHHAVARAGGDDMLLVCQESVGGVVQSLIARHLTAAGGRREVLARACAAHVAVLDAVRAGDGPRAARRAWSALQAYLAPTAAPTTGTAPTGGPALVPALVGVSADDVLEVLGLAAAAGVRVWVDGGWAVDALVGEQTREHGDLDLVVPAAQLDELLAALRSAGYADRGAGDGPANVVLADERGRRLDLHVIELDPLGNGRYGPSEVFPAAALTGRGTIGGRSVRCISPQWLVQFHTGYRVDADDWHDVAALCTRFDLPIPPDYAGFRAAAEGGPCAVTPVR